MCGGVEVVIAVRYCSRIVAEEKTEFRVFGEGEPE